MGLYQLFKDAFYDVMTRHGFIHQGNAFIRIVGEDIVQAVTIKPLTGYDIDVLIFPAYFIPNDKKYYFKNGLKDSKPYWVEDNSLWFKGFVDFPHKARSGNLPNGEAFYCLDPYLKKREDYVQKTIENLAKAAEVMEEFYIPQFDKIVDFSSYFAWKATDRHKKSVYGDDSFSDVELIYKAYLDGNFSWGKNYLDNLYKDHKEKETNRITRYLAWQETWPEEKKTYYHMMKDFDTEYKESMDLFIEMTNTTYKKFYESIEKNDTSWIVDYIKEQKEFTYSVLRARYSKLKEQLADK